MQDLIGRTLGHYRIVEQIGTGGMGVVYRAHDERLDRDVAIKVLPEEVATDPDRLRRFEREAKAVAALSHPNILEIFDFDTEGDVTYSATELLEGETLREHLQTSRGPLPWRRVQEIGAAVAHGLGAAHGKGVVHRDIKPSNIFLSSDGRVKILDFGLATTHEVVNSEAETASIEAPLTHEGSVMGTAGYMAPEQVRGEPVDHRSDVFALGCVLYEMLTGERAFKRDTNAETMTAILREEPPSFAETGLQVPPDLANTVSHCLEKNAERRFQSAADIAFALSSGSDITASPVMTGETSRLRTWVMPVLAVAGILVVALAMVIGPEVLERIGGRADRPLIRSIAILPLENLTGDPEQAYFVDGLHEELIATFAQISGFDKVIARTSVMGFRDSDTQIREIGRQLAVDAVIEGSVRRSGNTVRATLQLIDASTESNLWAMSFERDLKNILALQREVAVEVASEVRVALTPLEKGRLTNSATVNEQAYRAYRKGIQCLGRGPYTHEDLATAIELFKTAVAQDPDYAPAYVGLSKAYRYLALRYRPSVEVMPKAHSAAVKALELDDDSAEAHTRLGVIRACWTWDWSGAEAEFRRAFELSPNDVDVVYHFAQYLGCIGQSQEAIELQKRVVDLNPLDPAALNNLGWTFWAARQYDDAIEHLLDTVQLYPEDFWPRLILAWCYTLKGLPDEALAEIERAEKLHAAPNEDPFFLMSKIWPYSLAGRTAEANGALQGLLALREQSYVPPSYVAFGYIYLGDFDRAIEWMERAFEARSAHAWCLELPAYDAIRNDPRFQDIVRRMNFPEN